VSQRRRGVAIMVYNVDPSRGLPIGGMERQAAWIAERFVALGRRVVIVSTFFPWPIFSGKKNLRLFERRRGVLIYRVPCWSFHWWSWPTSQAVYETIAAWIVHRHASWIGAIYAIHGYSGGIHAPKVAQAVERPVVLKLTCSGEAGDLLQVMRDANRPELERLLRTIDRVVYLNDESRDEALAVGVAPERLVSIPNGIDLARFPRDLAPAELPELGPREGRDVVVFVGRLDRQKRVHVLIEAFAKIAARRPGARLAVVGEGVERAPLESLARERGLLGKSVFFLGVRPDVPNVLRAASVFVLPSAQEGMSNALLEAFAAGAPIVATDIPGNRDMVRDGREGLLVPADDAPALERALERLLEDKSLAGRLGRAARERAGRDACTRAGGSRSARRGRESE
jgi:glycosyltransferase involved in cell wall biosynthesis